MRAGPLRHRVTLQSQSQTRSATGAFTRTWTDVATVWASIEPSTGRQAWTGNTTTAENPVRIMVRYGTNISGINTTWRVKFGTRYFEIESVALHREEKEMYTLMCTEGEKDDE